MMFKYVLIILLLSLYRLLRSSQSNDSQIHNLFCGNLSPFLTVLLDYFTIVTNDVIEIRLSDHIWHFSWIHRGYWTQYPQHPSVSYNLIQLGPGKMIQ